MDEGSTIKIECELLQREKRNKIMGMIISYVLLFLFIRFLPPTYMKGNLIYKGLLKTYGMEEYIPEAYLLQLLMLLCIGYVFWRILTLSLKIKGVILISGNGIEVERWKKFKYYFRIDEIQDLRVQFNYFKKNDTEPRNMVSGNNNLLEFTRYGIKFKYEFLLQTEEEDEKFRAIMDIWKNKDVKFDYKTVLSDF